MTVLTLEDIVMGPDYADLDASPLQRAICRAAEGRPLDGILTTAQVEKHFGVPELPNVRPRLMVLVCGVRSGKSFLASSAAIHAGLTADCSRLKRHEIPRVPIIAPTVDAAKATFALLLGILQSSPVLSRFIDGEPTSETVVLRRPDGRRIEIVVVAALRGGLSVRNRWLAGFVLEEVAQFGAEVQGNAVTAEELLRAAETRLVLDAQGWLISSPFGPSGLFYDLFTAYFGAPSDRLVVHAETRAMNPTITQRQIDAIAEVDPDAARREFYAEWLDPDAAMFPAALVERATRTEPDVLPPEPGWRYFAASDPATRGNSWTLVVVGLDPDPAANPRYVVALSCQWTGSKGAPLKPELVLEEITHLVEPYGATSVTIDQVAPDYLPALARANNHVRLHQLTISAPLRSDMYESLRARFAQGEIELSPERQLVADLLTVRKRVNAGGVTIDLPKQPGGRHCDYVPSLALAIRDAARGATPWRLITRGRREMSANSSGVDFIVDESTGGVIAVPGAPRRGGWKRGRGGF